MLQHLYLLCSWYEASWRSFPSVIIVHLRFSYWKVAYDCPSCSGYCALLDLSADRSAFAWRDGAVWHVSQHLKLIESLWPRLIMSSFWYACYVWWSEWTICWVVVARTAMIATFLSSGYGLWCFDSCRVPTHFGYFQSTGCLTQKHLRLGASRLWRL